MRVSVGNILDEVKTGVIIQQVNAQGVMGSGIAKAIRDKWPVVWDEYSEIYGPNPKAEESFARLGKVNITQVEPTVLVANVVGQQFYGRHEPRHAPRYTSYDALDRAFTELAGLLRGVPVSLNFPLLGSDRGGGHWPVVKAIIEHRLAGFDLNLWLLPGVAEPT